MFTNDQFKNGQAICLLAGATSALFVLILLSQQGATSRLADTAKVQVAQVVSGTTITVANDAELIAAIKMAKGGETVLVQPGNYVQLKVQSMNYTAPVTFKSADQNNRANIKSLAVLLSSNVTIEGINFPYVFDSTLAAYKRANEINNSKNVVIKNNSFIGVNDATGYGAYQAIAIRWSDGVIIDNNVITNWDIGIVSSESVNLTLSKNDISAMAGDGIESAGNQHISVIGNYIHGFRRSPTSDMHPDSIQFWTNGTKVPSKNIIIKDNIIDQTGASWTQSIFMRNEAVDSKQIVDGKVAGYEMYYDNVLIENNKITNYHLHGITLGEAKNVIIRNNTLTAANHTTVDEVTKKYLLVYSANNGIYVPMIRPHGSSTNVRVENNTFLGGAAYPGERIVNYKGQTDWVVTGNSINGVSIVVAPPTTTVPTVPVATTTTNVPPIATTSPVSATNTSPTLTPGWKTIAADNQSFTIVGTQVVRYGAAPNWVEKVVTATGTCSSLFFGRDPSYKRAKICQVKDPVVFLAAPAPIVPVVTPPPSPTVVTSQYPAGTRVVTSEKINVRKSYGVNANLVGRQSRGAVGTVLSGGAQAANGYIWIKVDFDTGVDGWIADAFVSVVTQTTKPKPGTVPLSSADSSSVEVETVTATSLAAPTSNVEMQNKIDSLWAQVLALQKILAELLHAQ